ncbi:hypothetical protein PCANC_23095 [Puccinia coronata f. sp. avenae]|uniref:Uncharacterized protein n=1 Tax=Puccinia coronata f. sp. avenae TaxID=200324 RepID=A0A2N5U6G7_9BASI|nr:hypothetical protein PCANC_23095 [Puccinia coronata f. sp. avenae]
MSADDLRLAHVCVENFSQWVLIARSSNALESWVITLVSSNLKHTVQVFSCVYGEKKLKATRALLLRAVLAAQVYFYLLICSLP